MYKESTKSKKKPLKKIRFLIESELENTVLIGMSVNKICSLISLSSAEACQIELCVIEAVNNSIIHAYGMEKTQEVEVVLSIYGDRLILDVIDKGIPLDQDLLKNADLSAFDDLTDIDYIPENGRGLAIIKDIMDSTMYTSSNKRNCFRMIKRIPSH